MSSISIIRPKLVIFEGPDKVGKTTLFRAYREYTKYGPLAIDRFTGSNFVYDYYYDRPNNLQAYLLSEEKAQEAFDCYLVVLNADVETIRSRILEHETGKDQVIALDNFIGISYLFDEYFRIQTRYKQKLYLDTGRLDKAECLDKILRFTGEGGVI